MSRQKRPPVVVQIEDRVDGDEVHIRLVVGVDRSDVAPVVAVPVGVAGNVVEGEVVDSARVLPDEEGNDVSAHVVLRTGVDGVVGENLVQGVGVEDVVAHGGQELVGRIGQAQPRGVLGLFDEGGHAARIGFVDVDYAECGRQFERLADSRDRQLGAGFDVLVDHLREVHAVDVVRPGDEDDVGPLVVEDVERLVDGVGRPEVPVVAAPLLRGHGGDVVLEQIGHAPVARDVPVEGMGLVLGQDDDLQVSRIDDVAQRKVDESVNAAERHGGLGPILSEGHKALAFSASQDDGEDAGFGSHRFHLSHILVQRTNCPPLDDRAGTVKGSALTTEGRTPHCVSLY